MHECVAPVFQLGGTYKRILILFKHLSMINHMGDGAI